MADEGEKDERRRAPRFHYLFSLELTAEGVGSTIGFARDASRKGILVATQVRVPAGAEVEMAFQFPDPWPVEHVFAGVVVRAESASGEHRHEWPFDLAIEFDEVQPAFEAGLQVLLNAQ
jgi:hypothetical protein